uniref:Phospholipase A(2) n=1 Tax=Steinernema glaseri TaxID=37863 RepID=A0A1I7ZLY9_9BILA
MLSNFVRPRKSATRHTILVFIRDAPTKTATFAWFYLQCHCRLTKVNIKVIFILKVMLILAWMPLGISHISREKRWVPFAKAVAKCSTHKFFDKIMMVKYGCFCGTLHNYGTPSNKMDR